MVLQSSSSRKDSADIYLRVFGAASNDSSPYSHQHLIIVTAPQRIQRGSLF
jgi:hypothetical protein